MDVAIVGLPSNVVEELPEGMGYDASTVHLPGFGPIRSIFDGYRTNVYPISRDGIRLGVAIFGFDPSAPSEDREERTLASVIALLLLAGARLLEAEEQEMKRVAEKSWEERGRPVGSPHVDWTRAENQVKGRFGRRSYALGSAAH